MIAHVEGVTVPWTPSADEIQDPKVDRIEEKDDGKKFRQLCLQRRLRVSKIRSIEPRAPTSHPS